MKFLFALLTLLILGSAQAQTTKDSLYLNTGYVYTGKVQKIAQGNYIDITTDDGVLHHLSYGAVEKIVMEKPLIDTSRTEKPKSVVVKDESNMTYPPSIWDNKKIPQDIRHAHNVGVGLTVAGAIIIPAGIITLIADAASVGKTTTYNNGYGSQTRVSVTEVGLVGILSSLFVGIPVLTAGIITSHKAKKKALRYSR